MKPVDLLLDTVDPRSRLGQPLDFREFLPRTAWIGMTPDPGEAFGQMHVRSARIVCPIVSAFGMIPLCERAWPKSRPVLPAHDKKEQSHDRGGIC